VADPVSVNVETFGTAHYNEEKIIACVREIFPTRPSGLIAHLNLLRPIYQQTAAYGHFGREGFPGEATDNVEALKKAVG
jgi:S-adenosylmethionine synthetase